MSAFKNIKLLQEEFTCLTIQVYQQVLQHRKRSGKNFRALKEDKIVAAASATTADSATKLANARTIGITGDATGSATFDGSADVSISVDVTSADSAAACTGNAATAAKLETARSINGVAFDGTKDITITQVNGKDIATVDKIPTSLPASGGNATTVGGYTANNLMPLGAIVMWSGSVADIPDKWALCNGENGTPNLLDKFVVAAGNSYSVGANGGEATHTLTVAEMPSHTHSTTGSESAYGVGSSYIDFGFTYINQCIGGGNVCGGEDVRYSGYNKVGLTTSFTIGNTGSDKAHNNIPPYYALAYIMRTA